MSRIHPADESALRQHLAGSRLAFRRSTFGAALERAAAFAPPEPTELEVKQREAVQTLRSRLRRPVRRFVLGISRPEQFYGWWAGDPPAVPEHAPPTLHALAAAIEHAWTTWSRGGDSPEHVAHQRASVQRLLLADLRRDRECEEAERWHCVPSRPTREEGGYTPDERAMVQDGQTSRRLLELSRAGADDERRTLEVYYGPIGTAYERASLPAIASLLHLTQAGQWLLEHADALLSRGRGRAAHERMLVHCLQRDHDAYQQHRETFARAELRAERMYAAAVAAWRETG